MSSPAFIERFKHKISALTPGNLLQVNPQRVVSKPHISKVHLNGELALNNFSVNRSVSPNHSPLVHSVGTQGLFIKQAFFPGDGSSRNSLCRVNKGSAKVIQNRETRLNKSLEKKAFQPHTLNDYRNIKDIKYSNLGGLGPNVGSSQWLKKKYLSEKKVKYAQSVKRGYKRKNSDSDDGVSRKKLLDTFIEKVRVNRGNFFV